MARSGSPLNVDTELRNLDSLITQNDIKSLRNLIEKYGIDAHDEYKRTVLINAVAKGNYEIAKFAIENGADLNFQDRTGYSALHFCALYQYSDLTDLLIEKGTNIDIRDVHGNSPIWTALFNAKGDFTVVRKLYKAGADIEIKNIHGKSPRDFGEMVYQEKFDELIKG